MSDLALVRRLLAGDECAFDEFFADYFPRLYRFACARLGGNENAAEDVGQAALIKGVEKLHIYRGEAALFNQLNLKYRFTAPRTCFGGSPRITLIIDANGDRQFNQMPNGPDFAAHGHVNPPVFAACLQGVWRTEDMSDLMKRWETTPATALAVPCGPIGAVTTCTWDELEARVTAMFPNHKVLAGGLVDDTFGGPGQTGTAHDDLLTVENRTSENRQDTVP